MIVTLLRIIGRVILFLVTAVAVALAFKYATGLHHPPGNVAVGPWQSLRLELGLLAGAFGATGGMALLERRSIWSYGLSDAKGGRRYAWGFAVGFVALSGLIGLLALTGHITFEGRALSGLAAWVAGAQWALALFAVAMTEEMLFRGYLLQTLAREMGLWPAVVLLSTLFGVVHGLNPGEGFLGLIVAALGGLVLCYSIHRGGSLWFAIGFHTSMNWGQSYFYGTSTSGILPTSNLFTTQPAGAAWLSGGSVGPEGSAFIVPVFLLVVPAIAWVFRRELLDS